MEVFMDDFSVFGDSFDSCLNNLEQMLIRCKQAHLVLNWEKCHFMVTEGIVLGHKVSRKGLEVDKPKINVIAKLPLPTNVKAVRSFLGHVVFYRRFIKDFFKISRPMTKLLEKDLVFNFDEECNKAFETLKEKLTNAPIIVSPNLSLPFELIFVFTDHAAIKYMFSKQDVKPRLIRWILLLQEFDIEIKNKKGAKNVAADHLSRLEKPNLNELNDEEINDEFPDEFPMSIKTDEEESLWFADFANYLVGGILRKGLTTLSVMSVIMDPLGDIMDHRLPQRKFLMLDSIGQPYSKKHLFEYILVAIYYVSKWAEAKALPTNDARVVVNFLKKLFSRFGIPKALISDRGTHFCNRQMENILKKYGVHNHIATAYHPQTSGQVENTNRALKRILKKTVKDNPTVWSRKLDDALWTFRTAYKTPIGTTPYRLLYWALRSCNPDLKIFAGNDSLGSSRDGTRATEYIEVWTYYDCELHVIALEEAIAPPGGSCCVCDVATVIYSNSNLIRFRSLLRCRSVNLEIALLKTILWEKVLNHEESWTDYDGELHVIALEVERLIFKDLVNEVVLGEPYHGVLLWKGELLFVGRNSLLATLLFYRVWLSVQIAGDISGSTDIVKNQIAYCLIFSLIISLISNALSASPDTISILSHDASFSCYFQETVMVIGNDQLI
ncbi:reverse transcriptase domain-containing protein [Tanacetum coccineum]